MKKIFKKPVERELTKVEKRVAKIPTPELITWVDQLIYSCGRNLSTWQKTEYIDSLEEARIAAEALHAVLNALKERAIK